MKTPKATKAKTNQTPTTTRMLGLFPCSQHSFATWDPATLHPDEKGKLVPKYTTLRRAVTVDDWERHLAGQMALVIGLRCDDNTTRVTLDDVDQYDLDMPSLMKKIKLIGLPLYVSLSKSGGPHIVAFHDAPIPVEDSLRLGKEIVRRLGLSGKVDYFPTPQKGADALSRDVNMPYFGGKRGYLRLHGETLDEMPLDEFLSSVVKMTAEQRAGLLATALNDSDKGSTFAELMLGRYKAQVANEMPGSRNILINKVAYHLATMAARNWIEEARIEDELMATAKAAGWDNERKTLQTVRGAIRAGLKEPHDDVDEHYIAGLEAVMTLNKDHALILTGDKATVLLEEPNREFRLLTVGAFNLWLANRFVTMKDGDETKTMPLAKFWITHKQRRAYNNIVFRPGQEDLIGVYNLWRGWAVKPRKGDCSKFLAHVLDNVCCGDEDLFVWVIAWWADIVQRPAKKTGTSLAVIGEPGTGKSIIGDYMASVFGCHFVPVVEARFVTGRFNSHMAACLVLHADESFWAGDKKSEGKLKDMVTGTSHLLELKGKDQVRVDNYMRLFVTSESDWVWPASFGERRCAVLKISDLHQYDYPYFEALLKERDNGGAEALLHHLLYEVDCSKVNLRQIPHTAALLEQKIASMTAEQAWWLDILQRGQLPGDFKGEGVSGRKEMYSNYINHARDRGVMRRMSDTALGIFLIKYAPPTRELRPGGDRAREFAALSLCREFFANKLRAEGKKNTAGLDWGDEGDNWAEDKLFGPKDHPVG